MANRGAARRVALTNFGEAQLPTTYIAQIEDRFIQIIPIDESTVEVDGEVIQFDLRTGSPPELVSLLLNGRSYQAWVESLNGSMRVHLEGYDFEVKVEEERLYRLRKLTAPEVIAQHLGEVHAPMPGLVVKVLIQAGAMVKKGQGVMIVEAMKMENEIRAPVAGLLKEIRVEPRQAVEKGQILAVIGV